MAVKSYCVVAIPAKNDPVWQLSSERIPHMTLLFLGDTLNNEQHVTEFIEHATANLPKFNLLVENRDVLGDGSADVLFFDVSKTAPIRQFRQNLLSDTDIATAYFNTEQFPEWMPHLTMGYPETPAKENVHNFGLRIVEFDRISLWTEEYDGGVEFPLKNQTHGEEPSLSMSEKGKSFLQHYGVKGMHWGVTRKQVKAGAKAVYRETYKPSRDAMDTRKYQTKAKLGGVKTLNNAEMRMVINRMRLEQEYRQLYGEHQYHDEAVSAAKRWAKKGARWAGRFAEDVGKDAAGSWLKRPGSGGSSKGPIRVDAWTTGQQFAGEIDDSGRRAIGS